MVLLATTSAVVADPSVSLLNWDLADAPAEHRAFPANSEHARFRELLQAPESDSESFWDREQRWADIVKRNQAPNPLPSTQGEVSAPSDPLFASSIPLSDLSFALAPLLLAGGLLRLK